MKLGYRIYPTKRYVSQEIVRAYSEIPTSIISDGMEKMFAMDSKIRPFHPKPMVAGHAITIHCPPGDNLVLQKAIELAEPGDVLVLNTGGDTSQAPVGEIVVSNCIRRGAVGLVIDGAIRDSDILPTLTIPVFAKGVTHRGCYKDGPGELNVPIACGGIIVRPGDLVVGDSDGVVIVPHEEAEGLLPKLINMVEKEGKLLEQIRNKTVDRSWVDQELLDKGYTF
ncbi:RraA family protein [Bacillus sp. ISL-18]|uniref:RraA family protein n=1 Tax=Bacillus sp. ISL-18 TaxID=2819118 RepID=UPI001BEAF8CA|nr:RraA family protein [Bacillus sp. ISL-18]MBT2654992.1 RraA family protein [Bacillus sp. ISL-18]